MKTTEFKQIRQRMGWSLERLGKYLEVTISTVHRMEKGKTKIRRPVKMAMRALEKKAARIEKINKEV